MSTDIFVMCLVISLTGLSIGLRIGALTEAIINQTTTIADLMDGDE